MFRSFPHHCLKPPKELPQELIGFEGANAMVADIREAYIGTILVEVEACFVHGGFYVQIDKLGKQTVLFMDHIG